MTDQKMTGWEIGIYFAYKTDFRGGEQIVRGRTKAALNCNY